jgi:hypothetical protein
MLIHTYQIIRCHITCDNDMNLLRFRENLKSYKCNYVTIQQGLSTLSSYVVHLDGQNNGKAFDSHLRKSSNQFIRRTY